MSAFTYILVCKAQGPVIAWQKTYGGTKNDSLISIALTRDGGFIVSGFSNSDSSRFKTRKSYGGSYDFWIVKMNDRGNIQWEKTIGGLGTDVNPVIIETPDQGYLVGGKSMSDISGDKTENAINKSADYWLIKLDKRRNIQWNNTIGNIQTEGVQSLVNAVGPTGGYMVAGYSYSGPGNDKTDENQGTSLWADYWIMKLNTGGQILFDKSIGGKNEDFLASMKRTKDRGYMLAGYSYPGSLLARADSFKGNNDFWIVKIDSLGNKIWDRAIGGALSDYLTTSDTTADGGYIFGGYSNSPVSFDKSEKFKGVTDYWVVKTDANGNKEWDRTIGGSLGDYLTCVIQTSDKGYLLGGYSNSNISGDKTENAKGGDDIWLVKLNANGNIQWDKTFGGSGRDRLSQIAETDPGQYIVCATSNSKKSGDKTSASIGGKSANDYWILKLTTTGVTGTQTSAASEDAHVSGAIDKSDINKLTLRASPNPSKGLVELNYTGTSTAKASLTVCSSNGKIVTKKTLPARGNTYSIDLSKQAAGIYYITIQSKNSSATNIVVKQ